jgi:hypothetical protein
LVRIVEEHGQEIADCFLRPIRACDWKAAEAVVNRIYGRPDDALVVKAPAIAPAAQGSSARFPLEEKIKLLRRLRVGSWRAGAADSASGGGVDARSLSRVFAG